MRHNNGTRFFQGGLGFAAIIFFAFTLAAQVLPPPPASQLESKKLDSAAKLFVRMFQFEGNAAFSSDELSKVTASYTNREITSGELEEARRAVTLHYINHGYVNSGAILPDQTPTNGIVTLRVM